MKTSLMTIGSLNVDSERIWCADKSAANNPLELYAENGVWDIHILRSLDELVLFGPRNIMVAFSHKDFKYDITQCVSNFYSGKETIKDGGWGVIRDNLLIDTARAVFSTTNPRETGKYPNYDEKIDISWGEKGIELMTGYGDGNYTVYTFVKQVDEEYDPYLIIADFMIFADDIEIME